MEVTQNEKLKLHLGLVRKRTMREIALANYFPAGIKVEFLTTNRGLEFDAIQVT